MSSEENAVDETIILQPRWGNKMIIRDEKDYIEDLSPDEIPPAQFFVYSKIISQTLLARHNIFLAKYYFIKNAFKESKLVEEFSEFKLPWLPIVSDPFTTDYGNINLRDLFSKSFQMLQYFCIGLEHTVQVRTNTNDKFHKLFSQVEDSTLKVLDSLGNGMKRLEIEPYQDIKKEAMPEEYRQLKEESECNLRDFLLLRELTNAINVIFQMFLFQDPNLFDYDPLDQEDDGKT